CDLGATQERRLDGSVRRRRREAGLPLDAILALAQGGFQQREPRLRLGVLAAGLGDALLGL
ncbi:MAG: hypothetical protein DMD36_17945, partial [Gemmatimonadetes bacterium]